MVLKANPAMVNGKVLILKYWTAKNRKIRNLSRRYHIIEATCREKVTNITKTVTAAITKAA